MSDKVLKNDGKGTAVGNALRFLAKQGKTIAPGLLDIASKVTGIEALNQLGDAIKGDPNISDQDKELLLAELERDKVKEQEVTKRWEADMKSDSWLSKNIRPLTLAFLLFQLFVFIILDGSKVLSIKEDWISLLSSLLLTAVGGYFVIRGGEKMMNTWKGKK